ncbi:MAG: tetratricopeptide repeat protein [Caldilineaceae bacterium]|nr:tetratricopeptide repeat protein [Caldilineaceae bacterium]
MTQDKPLFARAEEMARLQQSLDRTLAGDGRLCLISGRAGTGKTFLMSEFIRRAQEQYPDVIVAVGTCDAQSGLDNPYLPFREALNLLLGTADERLAQTLVTSENRQRISKITLKVTEILVASGPDLIGLVVPGGNLIAKLATQAAKLGKTSLEKTEIFKQWENSLQTESSVKSTYKDALDQNQIYEQCSNVLCQLADEQPLILVLDDLHWADAASIGLLFRLGRRLESRPLLIVGAYRPDEIARGDADGRHPLTKVLTEFKRYLGDIWVDLDQATERKGQAFVDAFLDGAPNHLDSAFRRQFYNHTQGQPLFTVELFRQLQEAGGLIRADDGAWVASKNLSWDMLPKRMEGIIEERCARLTSELREILTVGSVEGQEFTTEVVAQVRNTDVRGLVSQLSRSAQDEQHLIQAQGVQRIGGRRISSYQFTSSIIQNYLYQALDEIERSYMHEDVGNALEALYRDEAAMVAVQLARHFDLADMPDKAVTYLRIAGDQAQIAYAHIEAIRLYSRALELLNDNNDNGDINTRYALLLTREHAFAMLGNRIAQAQDLETLMKLARQQNSLAKEAEVTLRRAEYAVRIGNFEDALTDAQAAIRLAQQAGDSSQEAWARYRCGSACWQLDRYDEARQYLEEALALTNAQPVPAMEANVAYELGLIRYYEDEYDEAIERLKRAQATFKELGDGKGEARCLSLEGVILDTTGDHGNAQGKFAQALQLARRIGWRYAEARFLNQSGENLIQLGDYAQARKQLRQAVALSREIDDMDAVAKSLDMCGLAALFQGNPEEARTYFDEALALHTEMGSRRGEGFVLTHLGALLTETEEWEAAIDILNQAWELRAQGNSQPLVMETLAALARLALRLGDAESAEAYISDILAWLPVNGTDGMEYPTQVYLACYEVLAAQGRDNPQKVAQAQRLLTDGHEQLMARADRLDGEARMQFLQNVPFNRDLHQHWQTRAVG